MLGTINLRFVIVVSTLTICFFAGWWINGWRWEAKSYAATQLLMKQSADMQKMAEEYELIQQSKDTVQNVITKQVYIETTKPDYTCRIPDTGLQLLRNAVETANSGKFDNNLPSSTSR